MWEVGPESGYHHVIASEEDEIALTEPRLLPFGPDGKRVHPCYGGKRVTFNLL